MADAKRARGNRFAQAAQDRIKDARILTDAATGRFGQAADPKRLQGAAYLAGIAVECQAKWILCERQGVTHVDDFDAQLVGGGGHDLERIVRSAGLLQRLSRSEVAGSWELVKGWNVELRYEPAPSQRDELQLLQRLVAASEDVLAWLQLQVGR